MADPKPKSKAGQAVERPKPKKAIVLGGGGPAAGLHIGVLEYLEGKVEFDVWALSCIGAWVGIVYNHAQRRSQGQKNTRIL